MPQPNGAVPPAEAVAAPEPRRTALNRHDASGLFARMFKAEEPPEPESPPTQPEGEEEDGAPVEGHPDNAQVEGDDAEDVPVVTGDEEPAEEDEAAGEAVTYPVTIDGEVRQVPLADLVGGYMQRADYTRKTQALAEERRTYQAERQAFHVERQRIAQQLDTLAPALIDQWKATELPAAQLEELKRTDPGEWARYAIDRQERMNQLKAAAEQRMALIRQEEAEQMRAIETQKPIERAKLMELVPAFRGTINPQTSPDGFNYKVYDDVQKFLLGQSFSPEELGGMTDHRYVAVAYKAMLADRAARATAKAAPKLAKLPQPIRPGAAKPRQKPGDAEMEAFAAKVKKLKATGNVRDGGDVFAEMYK